MDISGFAIVTGAGSGIGRDVSFAYAVEGVAGILIADINETAALETAAKSRMLATNPEFQAHALKVDVSSEESVFEMVKFAIEKFGRIDYCVNSAGVGVEEPREISEASLAEFERFWRVNVQGSLLCVKAVSAVMKKQDIVTIESRNGPRPVGRGSIINLGSCNSYVATHNIVQYTTSKHAVMGMTKSAALDNAQYYIRVNAICPSWVETPMVERARQGDPALGEMMKKVIPLGRTALQDEISDVIMFLSSPRSSYVTGCGWIVDGGVTLQVQR